MLDTPRQIVSLQGPRFGGLGRAIGILPRGITAVSTLYGRKAGSEEKAGG